MFLLLLASTEPLFAQAENVDTPEKERSSVQPSAIPLVYIDCERCAYDHIRREITLVNYVRDPDLANVHVFITDEGTGDGGREYEITFIGREKFNGMEYTITRTMNRNATIDETRESLNRVLEIGLSPYTMQVYDTSRFSLQFEASDSELDAVTEVQDPWNYWVFEIYAGSLQLDLESNQEEFDSRWGFYADRVTEEWKIRLRPYFNYEYVEINQEDGEEPVISRLHRHGFDSYAIKSLGDHWSAGLFGDYITRTDRNLRHRFRLTPGVEYNIFPYQQATRKSITFRYQLGYSHVDYYEETIFNKTREGLVNQELSAAVQILQPWGEIEGGVEGSHYFHDFAHRRAEVFGSISVRLAEGLSLNFSSQFEMIQDQLSLPLGDTSLEDVLLRQRELATDFSLSGSISLSYTFGSDFANVVNTRF
ncbi:hypothetical protein ACG2F4_07915 [Halalkalibaculum sp. DA3122]|uniref:hypothetical protein n=1 Tax=Halalkalibaculum sp. DA3122 TaxID=3373607 RepID=UPI0037546B8A